MPDPDKVVRSREMRPLQHHLLNLLRELEALDALALHDEVGRGQPALALALPHLQRGCDLLVEADALERDNRTLSDNKGVTPLRRPQDGRR
jgi:hypothetical protein